MIRRAVTAPANAKPAVPRELPDAARSSKAIATARSRSSAGCCFRDVMSPNFPRGHSLQETRGGPSGGLAGIGLISLLAYLIAMKTSSVQIPCLVVPRVLNSSRA